MNKKIAVGVGIAVLTIVIAVVGFKTTLGDKAMGLPGEENTENALHLQESNGTTSSANTTKSAESASTESSESGP
ncbi:hypothetical protein [Candidatus Nitrosotalea okcheonensis]|uniref:Uncharacterized protein n=1 Tax=Candidatus Nitrosotalea okcheonensis TaxID=1903276 RepID=A0A2H1FCU1_9ARCH|nr:hypothetical protein [Candidatus Nitrosotalea okcheonensis]MDE1832478.1 hypothetical protein [Nitrososphaerota archaeon]MDE1877116.1 hypothetical protein [Nitrososphaerota archaeon]SMH70571.1 conserved exported protein of unknown function [Candidatus Nitrosotalea okcheonensis]